MGRETYEPALAELDKLYGVEDVDFRVGPLRSTVHWIRPNRILRGADVNARITGLLEYGTHWGVMTQQGVEYETKRVVLATGVWANELVPTSRPVKGMAGMAFLWPGKSMDDPFISPWAPYRQLIAFDRGDGMWVGDGTSILHSNWTADRGRVSEERCVRAIGGTSVEPTRLFGIRPYVDMKPCLLEESRPGLWVATGGAKNGTLAAGWCGAELARRLS